MSNETYYIVVNPDKKTFNAFDEDNLKFIPNEDWVACKVTGDDNCNAVLGLLWKVLPDFEQIKPNF